MKRAKMKSSDVFVLFFNEKSKGTRAVNENRWETKCVSSKFLPHGNAASTSRDRGTLFRLSHLSQPLIIENIRVSREKTIADDLMETKSESKN